MTYRIKSLAGIWADGVGVETGALRAGERLPTIRSLAKELAVDPKLP